MSKSMIGMGAVCLPQTDHREDAKNNQTHQYIKEMILEQFHQGPSHSICYCFDVNLPRYLVWLIASLQKYPRADLISPKLLKSMDN